MADEDRAAKAARAKAMLKKRQQQKKAGAWAVAETGSPPASRAMSPAPSQVAEGANEFGELLSRHSPTSKPQLEQSPAGVSNEDVQPVVLSPSIAVESETPKDTPPATVANGHVANNETVQLLQEQRQTIALLVSEKASITEKLEQFDGIDIQLDAKKKELQLKYQEADALRSEKSRLETEHTSLSSQVKALHAQVSQITSKSRDLERDVQSLRAEAGDLQARYEQRDRRARELEEQIQNDDRADKLEAKLKNTLDRAEEFEFQLSKLRQTHATLKSDHDDVVSQLQHKSAAELEWMRKHADLENSQLSHQEQITSLSTERDQLSSSSAALDLQLQSATSSLKQSEEKLAQANASLTSSARQLEAAQNEMRTAQRRADEAEEAQKKLQDEGTGLMRSLEEMRPKIVELTEDKLQLSEKVERLTSNLSQRDATIALFEEQLAQSQQSGSDVQNQHESSMKTWQAEKATNEKTISELQQALSELQTHLDNALASARELEADRAKHRQTSVRQHEEIEKLTQAQWKQEEEGNALRQNLEERMHSEEDNRQALAEVQSEVETLREQLSAKEDELQGLRPLVARYQNSHESSHSARDTSSRREDGEPHFAGTAAIDEGLPPAIRHQRHVSLAMLQARMYSEAEAANMYALSKGATENSLSSSHEHHSQTSAGSGSVDYLRWPQFLDESHVFWCSSCKGDLIVL